MMKKAKQWLRYFLWGMLIILAAFGVALTGVAPTFQKPRNKNQVDQTELVEQDKEESENAELGEEVKG